MRSDENKTSELPSAEGLDGDRAERVQESQDPSGETRRSIEKLMLAGLVKMGPDGKRE